MTVYYQQQQQANRYLTRIEQLLDPNAVLAGGAPRDWFFNRNAKDLDIFVYLGEQNKKPSYWKQKLEDVGFKVSAIKNKYGPKDGMFAQCFEWTKNIFASCKLTKSTNQEDYILSMNPYLECVVDIEVESGENPVQIMIMNQPVDQCTYTKFPVSISQIWYKNGKFNKTPDFLVGIKHNIIYPTGIDNSMNGKYTKKVREKFPEFEYLDSKDKVIHFLSDKLSSTPYR